MIIEIANFSHQFDDFSKFSDYYYYFFSYINNQRNRVYFNYTSINI